MATFSALTTAKIRIVAEQYAIRDLPGFLNEIYLLISATQGLAIGRDLTEDKTMTAASLALLKERYVAALKDRIALSEA